jgi:DNA-binding MarR family transcriptional regulator
MCGEKDPPRVGLEAGPPTDSSIRILHALRRLMRLLDIHSRRLATEKDVTSAQLFAMKMLAVEGVDTATEVARRVHLSPSTVVGILDRLEEKRLVERRRDQTDRRVVRLSLTREGSRLIRETPHPVQDLLAESKNGMSEEEERRIAEALEALVAHLGGDEVDGATPYGELDRAEPTAAD